MNISYHPNHKTTAKELKKFLEKEGINQDINYVIGGDGSLFTYLSTTKPNLLISPHCSAGYYAATRINNYQAFIKDYLKNPEKSEKRLTSIKVRINGDELRDQALNDVLITEGLHRLSRLEVNGHEESNSGILIYTHHGWQAYAKNLGADQYGEDELGVIGIATAKGRLSNSQRVKKLSVKLLARHRRTGFNLYVDCKDIKPYDPYCTDKKKVYHKPYKLSEGDKIIITRDEVIIIQ